MESGRVLHNLKKMQYLHHLGIWFEYCLHFKCNTYIILEYLHSPWNLEGYYITLPKPISNTIPTPYCKNILNHGTNEGIVKFVTLMVKGNETITKMSFYCSWQFILCLCMHPYGVKNAHFNKYPRCLFNGHLIFMLTKNR